MPSQTGKNLIHLYDMAVELPDTQALTDSSKGGMRKAFPLSATAVGAHLEELRGAFQPTSISIINLKETLTFSPLPNTLSESVGEHLEELRNAFRPLSLHISHLKDTLTFSSSPATQRPLTYEVDGNITLSSDKIINRRRPLKRKAPTKPDTGLLTPPETPSEHSLAEEDVSETSMAHEDNTNRPPTPSSSTEEEVCTVPTDKWLVQHPFETATDRLEQQPREDEALTPPAADEAIVTAAIDTVLDDDLAAMFDQESQPSDEVEAVTPAVEEESKDDGMQLVLRRRLPETEETSDRYYTTPMTDAELSRWAVTNNLDGIIPRGDPLAEAKWREQERAKALAQAKMTVIVKTEWLPWEDIASVRTPYGQMIFDDLDALKSVAILPLEEFLRKFPEAWTRPGWSVADIGQPPHDGNDAEQERHKDESVPSVPQPQEEILTAAVDAALEEHRDIHTDEDVQLLRKAEVARPDDYEDIIASSMRPRPPPLRRRRQTVQSGPPRYFSQPSTNFSFDQWAKRNGLDGIIPRSKQFRINWTESTRDRDLEGAKRHVMVWTEWAHREDVQLIRKPNAQLIFSDPEVLEEVSDIASKLFLEKYPDAWSAPATHYDADGDEDSDRDGDSERDEDSKRDGSSEQEGSFEQFGSSEQEGSSEQDGHSGGSGTSPPAESNASPSIGSKPGHEASGEQTESAPTSTRAADEAPSKKPAKQSRFAAFFAQQEAEKKSFGKASNELDSLLRGYDEPLATAAQNGEASLPVKKPDQEIQINWEARVPEYTKGYDQVMVRSRNAVWWEMKVQEVRREFRNKLPSTLAEEVLYRQFLGYQSFNESGDTRLVILNVYPDEKPDKSGWYPSTNITPYHQTMPYRRFLFDPKPFGAQTPGQVQHESHPVLVARHQVMGRRFCKAPEGLCYARHFVERKPQFDDGMNKARRFWVHLDGRLPKELDFSQKAIDAVEVGPSSPIVKKEDDNYGSMGFDPSIVESPSLMGEWSETVPRRDQPLRRNTRNRRLLSKRLRRRQPLSKVSERQLAAFQALHDSKERDKEMEQEAVEQEEVEQEEMKNEDSEQGELTARRPPLQALHEPKEKVEEMKREQKAVRASQTASIRDRLWKGYAVWQEAGSRPPPQTLVNSNLRPAPTANYLPPGFSAAHDPF
ncbi:hypothetical protein H2199_005592 [Coniosporium tulheliwenetii]|uniref:Uncharacterized protein n=1 Tax=Coniosporium tulheliwenetii TaxID=3383036 RepID=A0ACC2YZR3_9PEZI|nr:hypothetical protein H2199_005592 [Cladosporium sp. JES 115]